MADIISIATAVPQHSFTQRDMASFMKKVYQLDPIERRRLTFMYLKSDINLRYSVIDDYTQHEDDWDFITLDKETPLPGLDERMKIYDREALPLSIQSIHKCIDGHIEPDDITHLITISCTGMTAPGLDLQITEEMNLSPEISRTSINFMGCYAAVHGLKMAKYICDSTPDSNVVIVATELCSIHFQKEYIPDYVASSLLFGDGSAAVLVSNKIQSKNSLKLKAFYSQVAVKGVKDMAWALSSKGFLMTLSTYVPELVEQNIFPIIQKGLEKNNMKMEDITHWCLHPGGKKILNAIRDQLHFTEDQMKYSRSVLAQYGNMSSPSVLFVLKEIMNDLKEGEPANIFAIAMGPGLTMETFIAGRE